MDSLDQLDIHLKYFKKDVNLSISRFSWGIKKTYIESTQNEDLQPNHLDSGRQACVLMWNIVHVYHKDHVQYMDLSIVAQYKLCCQGNQNQSHNLLFWLK